MNKKQIPKAQAKATKVAPKVKPQDAKKKVEKKVEKKAEKGAVSKKTVNSMASKVVSKAQDAKKKVQKGVWTKRTRKVRTSASFRRPHTKILQRKPKCPKRSVPHRPRLDRFSIIKHPLTTESAMKRIEDKKATTSIVDFEADKTQTVVKELYQIAAQSVNTLIKAGSSMRALLIMALLVSVLSSPVSSKILGFRDSSSRYLVIGNQSNIKVIRERIQDGSQREVVQTIRLASGLVDFDLNCSPNHCYLIAVSNTTKGNVHSYRWLRTQFNTLKEGELPRDSFARPRAVKIIRINRGFYIAIAQDQYHLSPIALEEESPKFIGCAILKFSRGREKDKDTMEVKYHQFIKLPFNPRFVNHFVTISTNNMTDPRALSPSRNHHLIFSTEPDWATGGGDVRSFIWSPLNDYFWPYRMPREAEIKQSAPGTQVLKFPELLQVNQTDSIRQQDYIGSIESCFHQLQRLLADRELRSRQLIESSKTIWQAPKADQPYNQIISAGLTNISARVLVHGNVIVKGQVIDNPRISLIARWLKADMQPMPDSQLVQLIQSHSPQNIEHSIIQANAKLDLIRNNLDKAFLADLSANHKVFKSEVRFLGGIIADEVSLQSVTNSDVRLNGIPFKQLENELVSLNGAQNIGGRVVFTGKVVADRLEIHGLINGLYHLKDAIDITSDRIQVIELTDPNQVIQTPGLAATDFRSVSAPDLILAHNATFNAIRLADFITRDNRTQIITGRKTFKHLSMGRLNLAHPAVQLNGVNISRIGQNAVRLRPELGITPHQSISNDHRVTFLKSIRANKLVITGLINHHINITSLIYDSIKTDSFEVQQIFGQKNFLNGLKIEQLDTEGALNGIKVDQIFNLNAMPPVSKQLRFANVSVRQMPQDVPVTGELLFRGPVRVLGSVNANLVNQIDLSRRAVRRLPASATQLSGDNPKLSPQIVRGHKTFYRPVRIIDDIRLIDPIRASQLTNSTRIPFPLVNGVDMRAISEGLARQMQQPTPILVENFEIEGNLEILHQNRSQVTFGNYTNCPLDFIKTRALLGGWEDQLLEVPIRVNSLRAKNILVDRNALNGLDFPTDFILRTDPDPSNGSPLIESVQGFKTFEHIVVSPSVMFTSRPDPDRNGQYSSWGSGSVVFEPGVSINQVPWSELQSFMTHERNLNSTGEKVYNTINVYGNLHVKRINGYYWPDDILLRSVSSTIGQSSVQFHKRIYSHLIFTNSSSLNVENQLVLRGPAQLNGRMNGVNLTEFSRSSATYGDKDLYSSGRPIRNKIFLGGLTVRREIRSSGTIDNVNIDEMKNRVALIKPANKRVVLTSQKVFMSDIWFDGPIRMVYLNELPIDNYLNRIKFEPDGTTLRVRNKKTITGALRINSNLFVYGLINGIDFRELKARAVSLSPAEDEVVFNRTLILEGDAYMDNLWIERDGSINSVKLTNLLPLRNEIEIQSPRIAFRPYGNITEIHGGLDDCQVRCEIPHQSHHPIQPSIREPFSIRYEKKNRPVKRSHPVDAANIEMQLEGLRMRFISVNLVRLSESAQLVVGFIDAPTNDVSTLTIPDQDVSQQLVNHRRFYTPLDQIDFQISATATVYQLSVGLSPDFRGRNVTTVSYLKGNHTIEASVLPVEHPKSAMFITSTQTLFLLVSQDLPNMCERTQNQNSLNHRDGVHVYMFQAFMPDSTSRQSAYFDLYQTIDLDGVDSFEEFSFHDSSYVLAISRASNRIYVLLLRGYTGFHVVSSIDAPRIETVTVMYSTDQKPMFVIHQTDGTHRVMESVII